MKNKVSFPDIFDLSGRVVWFVGGAGYLGLPAVEALAARGAEVIIGDNRITAGEAALEKLAAKGFTASFETVDFASEESISNAVKKILSKYGRLDVAINATTYSCGKLMDEMTLDEWNAGLKVTLTGAFLFAREVSRVMIPQKSGSIIQFSSMYGVVSPDPRIYFPPMNVNPVDYGVSKAGLMQMVRYQAVAWASHNVRVNSIVPGPFPNSANELNDEAFVSRLSAKVPMGRVGRAEEIAGAVVFLASDAASFVTGTQITVDGGWIAW